jgi:hypothetical protein
MMVAIALAAAALFVNTGAAEAVTVRPGAKAFQVDVMLDGYETEQARRSFWAATVICWNSGVTGKLLGLGPCQAMVSVCAAQAYYSNPRRWAGITFALGTAWCWKY